MTDINSIPERIKAIYSTCTPDEQEVLRTILKELAETGYSKTYEEVWLADYKEIPVDKETFLTSEEFLGASNDCGRSIYPVWLDVMKELEQAGNQYYEIVFSGATRTGKTSTAVSDGAYQLYRIMCLRNPQEYFGLKKVTRISFFFFNLTETLAKGVAYKEFISTLQTSKWFASHGHFTDSETNPAYIPEGGLIEIVYGSAASHALGKATYCVIFDEVNFGHAGVKDVLKAKKAMKEKYDTLVARVTGTFVKNGEVFGKIYVISSKREDSDFMEEYVRSQREAGNQHMYVFDKPQWEVWPKSKYSSSKTFKIALGGKHLRSFVVSDEMNTPEGLEELRNSGYRLLDVPEDNKTRFLSDFDVALRDIAGITVQGSFSFITQDLLDRAIGERKNPFYKDIIEVGTQDKLSIEEFFHLECVDSRLIHMPMFIHLDLSLTTDRSGISGIVISGRKDIDLKGKVISVPTFSHVFSIAVQAPRGDKISYMKINQFICWLRNVCKFNISCVSRDQFQSEYMAQLLEAQGFNTAKISLDRTSDGYDALKSAILEQRIDLLHVELLETELTHLKRDPGTGICDHEVGGSKDMSDSVAGSVWNAILLNPGVPVPVKAKVSAIAAVNGLSKKMNPGSPSSLGGAFSQMYNKFK